MNSKKLFFKVKDLAPFWAKIAHDDQFELVLTFARAEFAESQPSSEELRGAERFAGILQTLADNEEGSTPFPSPGLHHHIDKLPERPVDHG